MSLSNFATTDDVAALLQRDLTAAELPWANRLLMQASAVVRRYTRQTLNYIENDIVTLPGNWTNVLTLPQRPVSTVSSVSVNGSVLDSSVWVLNNDRLFIGTGSWQLDYGMLQTGDYQLMGPAGSTMGPQSTGSSWRGPQARVTVTYTHGFADIPSEITNITAGLVALAIASPVGVDQERIGGYQVKYTRSEGGAMALQAADKTILNDFRRRVYTTSIAPLR